MNILILEHPVQEITQIIARMVYFNCTFTKTFLIQMKGVKLQSMKLLTKKL